MTGAIGRFDGRFLGVTLRFGSPSVYDTYLVATENRVDGGTRLDEIAAADEFLFEAGLASVLDHEVRHFHDFLLSPFGTAAVQTRVGGTINGLQLISQLRAGSLAEVTCLPTPIGRWLGMSVAEQERFVDQLRSLSSVEAVVPRVSLSDQPFRTPGLTNVGTGLDALRTLLGVAAEYFELLGVLWSSPVPQTGARNALTTSHGFELAATVCQIHSLAAAFSPSSAVRFAIELTTRMPPAYVRPMQAAATILGPLEIGRNGRDYLALATWALLGRYDFGAQPSTDEMMASCPMVRLGRLRAAQQGGLSWSTDDDAETVFARWDEAVGVDTMAALRSSVARTAEYAVRFRGRVQTTAGLAVPAGDQLATLVDAYATAHSDMVDAFLHDPERLIDPVRYTAEATELPTPAVALLFESGGLDADQAEARGLTTFLVGETTDGRRLARVVGQPWQAAAPAIAEAMSFDALSLFALADALFSSPDATLSMIDRAMAESALGDVTIARIL